MNTSSQQIVAKAWNFAHVLRDEGLSYMAYTEQITFLLFLKMADEQTKPPYNRKPLVPRGYGWPSLDKAEHDGEELVNHYRHILDHLSKQPGMLGHIFRRARPEGRLVLGWRRGRQQSEGFQRAYRESSKRGSEITRLCGTQSVDRSIASRRQDLRTACTSHTTRVLAEGRIAYAVQAILDRPMRSVERQQSRRIGSRRRRTGDAADGLLLHASVGESPHAAKLEHLSDARPVRQELRERRRGGQFASLDPSMPLVRARAGIPLRRPLLLLVGGKRPTTRRACRRCRSEGWVGCL